MPKLENYHLNKHDLARQLNINPIPDDSELARVFVSTYKARVESQPYGPTYYYMTFTNPADGKEFVVLTQIP